MQPMSWSVFDEPVGLVLDWLDRMAALHTS